MTPCERERRELNCGLECQALLDGDCDNDVMLAYKAEYDAWYDSIEDCEEEYDDNSVAYV